MKKVYKDKIINIPNTELFDNKLVFDFLLPDFGSHNNVEVVVMSELLEARKNSDILEQVQQKPAMYSNVYSPKDELEIFERLFEDALKNNKKIHIVGITLDAEVKILEKYYEQLGFLRSDMNCYEVHFNTPLITASVKIENLMWKGSDYKRMGKNIFFNPPVRESGENKAMFKGINRGVIAGVYIGDVTDEKQLFLSEQITQEKILPLTFAKVFRYNLDDIGLSGSVQELVVAY